MRIIVNTVIILLLSACATPPTPKEKYPNAFQEIHRADIYIKKNEKIISDLDMFLMINRAAIRSAKSGGAMAVNGKVLTEEEANLNLEAARSKASQIKMLKDKSSLVKKRREELIRQVNNDNAPKIQDAVSNLSTALEN